MPRRRTFIVGAFWIVTAPCACAPATPSIFELPIPPDLTTAAPPPPVSTKAETADEGDRCGATLHLDKISPSSASCIIDEHVRGRPGELHYACDGGSAYASFGASRFRGSVRNGTLEMALTTEFKFTDGCQWVSQQRIRGRLAGGTLDYSYSEAPVPGQSGCAGACTATGFVSLDDRIDH